MPASMGLTYINDASFQFFLRLEQSRINLLNTYTVKREKDNVVEMAKMQTKKDKQLKEAWISSFEVLKDTSDSKITIISQDVKISVALAIVDELFEYNTKSVYTKSITTTEQTSLNSCEMFV